ncbi:hypothetical protein [Sphingobium sp. EP60837]|uniref:hypothetical protein n=1 Tax=Sphingobium sp. EP60837 TaxID=1855519 RepID=UPI0007DDEF2A|nr:hypothetical protein [Sphingobium sp. EP60837]ANI79038.1 hypothetical protein EP837_02643 [Sphingobium sp. EP60837]
MFPDENNQNIGEEVRAKEKKEHRDEIAAWLKGVLDNNTDLKATAWSVAAGLSRSTVSRALNPKYDNILSIVALYKLAKKAGVPTPVHLGIGAPGVPPPIALAAIFRGILSRLTPERTWSEDVLMALGEALQLSLVEAQETPEIAEDLQAAELVGRMAARRLSGRENNPDET